MDAGDINPAYLLVSHEHSRDVGFVVAEDIELSGKLDGVVDRKLGARADGEMRRVGAVPHQYDVAIAVEVAPLLANQPAEVQPGRAAHMARIGHQLMAVERLGKEFFAELNRLLLVHLVETMGLKDVIRGFDDEGRSVLIEAVDMRLEPAVFGALEVEGEGVEALVRAEPDITVWPNDHVGLEYVGVSIADPRVDAVGGDDEVRIGEFLVAFDVVLEREFDTEFEAAILEDIEHLLAADADEAVARRPDLTALENQFDVVPVVEGDLDRLGSLRIPLAHRLHRRIREDHPPPEGVEGAVPLDDRYAVFRVLALHQQRKIEAGWPATDTDDPHVVLLPSSGCVCHRPDVVDRHPGLRGAG